jgi:SusD family.
MRFKRTNF